MTIHEVLTADWDVDAIKVAVYVNSHLETEYHIGERVKPGKYDKYICTTTAGDVYVRDRTKQVYVSRPIQNRNWSEAKDPTAVGVVLKQIPKELLELEVQLMNPEEWRMDLHASGMHGYEFSCCPEVMVWPGIKGEDEVIEGD